ncbi:MAG: type IV toxin-antitoxin system AbiEi family antitoxin domain-containing protein [Coriobacteriia bacterium]|nr:type IV toxin-antitoxin system AbiEi family antitoxin domain-containing protein [Coriobacteriia bacterium]
MRPSDRSIEHARNALLAVGGIARTSYLLRAGVQPRTLYWMRDEAMLEQVSRGLYRLADLPALTSPDLATVAARIPKGVICLISALAFHEVTDEIPHRVDVALPPGSEEPRLDYPPIRTYRLSGRSYLDGIEEHVIDGVTVRVYSLAKTIADCFKFRNRIGTDVAVQALREALRGRRVRVEDLVRFARVDRVDNVMRPYLEAVL